MRDGDAVQVLDIYAYGLGTRNATFETKVPTWEEWNSVHHSFCRFVYVQDSKVVGWVASCYRGVAEISVYVADGFSGRGIGTRLLKRAVEESELNGIWTLFASVFPENQATIRLHLQQGFRKMGIRKRIAQLDGQWRDTLILERRSDKVGVD